MSDFMDSYFGPLDKNACLFFNILSIMFAILFVIALIFVIKNGVKNYKHITVAFILSSAFLLITTYFAYFEFRLFHTMCVNSV